MRAAARQAGCKGWIDAFGGQGVAGLIGGRAPAGGGSAGYLFWGVLAGALFAGCEVHLDPVLNVAEGLPHQDRFPFVDLMAEHVGRAVSGPDDRAAAALEDGIGYLAHFLVSLASKNRLLKFVTWKKDDDQDTRR